MKLKTEIMDEETQARTIVRIAHEILERNADRIESIALVGIRTRGVPFAKRIADEVRKFEGIELPVGTLDITLYRDDLSMLSQHPVLSGTDVPFAVTKKIIVLADDVLYTGRTVRAAIEAVSEMGRPDCIQLAVLVDRGHRELPFRADYVGKNLPTSGEEIVNVCFREIDGRDGVGLYTA